MSRAHVLLVGAGLAASCSLHAAEAPWREIQSPHITVVTNGGEKEARRLAWQFEQMRAVLVRLWPWARIEAGRPVVVFAARNEETMRSLVPEYWETKRFRPVAVNVSTDDRHFTALRLDVAEPNDRTVTPYFDAYRAYVQVAMNEAFPHTTPLWFRRGMAEVFANTVVRDDEVHIGRPVSWHVERLRDEPRVALRDLLAADRNARIATDEVEAHRFSAQAWALVHFLLFGDQAARARQVDRFVGLLREGRPADVAQREAFGDLAQHESALNTYSSRQIMSYARAPLAVAVKAEGFASRALSPAQGAALRASLHVAMRRPVEARALAAEARQADPGLPAPWEIEARLLDQESRRDEARDAYVQAVERGSTNFHVHYRAAQLIWKPNAEPALRQRIAGLLEKSIALNADYANAYSYLADVKSGLGAAEPALELARKAIELEPRESYQRLTLARVLWDLKRPDDARLAAQAALQLADSDRPRQEAREFLDFLAERTAAAQSRARARECFEGRQAAACTSLAPDLERACDSGQGRPCAQVAWLYEQGLGVAADPARATSLYAKSCQAGEMDACLSHSHRLLEGLGTPKDVAAGTARLEALCSDGTLEACFRLAFVFLNQNTPKGRTRARELLQGACAKGDARSCSLVEELKK